MLSLKFLYNSPLGFLITGLKRSKGDVVTPAVKDPSLANDPLRASYVRSIPEAQLYRGVLLQGYLVPSTILEGLENMEIREDDVFIITYPKSGTTWTEEIVSLIYNNGDIRRVEKELLVYRVQHLEVGRLFGHLSHLGRLKSPRLMATHLPLALLPRQLRQAKCKIIYVVRNPKDTAVSYYHHHKMSTFLGNYSGTWKEFLQYFMAGHLVYGSWFDHVLPYWSFCHEHPDKVFLMCYEELKMDLKGMADRLCKFLGKNLSESVLDVISEHCSFERMKTNRMVNREVLPIVDLFDMSKSKFMRKGIVGDWKNFFTEEESESFDKLYKEKMEGSDLDLVFEPDEAIARYRERGRIIYNHPQVRVESVQQTECWQREIAEDTKRHDFFASEIYQPMTPRHFAPLQVHTQPDPLTLDAV